MEIPARQALTVAGLSDTAAANVATRAPADTGGTNRGTTEGMVLVASEITSKAEESSRPCPLAFGAASRPLLPAEGNGDTFVIKRWDESALVAVIDGLGHGKFAHEAAWTAGQYVESHFDQPLAAMFHGVGRACRVTRGVVMAVARFDWAVEKLTFASVGNVEVRVGRADKPMNFHVRRGVLGANAPAAAVTEHRWHARQIMVLHTDGLTTHWQWQDFPDFAGASATHIARRLLDALARDWDDATVVVVRDDAP